MNHVPLDITFKCARIDASYTCLRCRLKKQSQPRLLNPSSSQSTSEDLAPTSLQINFQRYKRKKPRHASFLAKKDRASAVRKFEKGNVLRKHVAGDIRKQICEPTSVFSQESPERKVKESRFFNTHYRTPDRVVRFHAEVLSDLIHLEQGGQNPRIVKHAHRDQRTRPTRVLTHACNVNNVKFTFGVPGRAAEAEVEALQAEHFLEVLDSHGEAAEDTAEGLKSWKHFEDAGEIDDGSVYRPFSEDTSVYHGGVASESEARGPMLEASDMISRSVDGTSKMDQYKKYMPQAVKTPRRIPHHPVDAPRIPSMMPSCLRSTTLGPHSTRYDTPRLFHTSTRVHQQAAAAAEDLQPDGYMTEYPSVRAKSHKFSHIRQQLRQWQDEHGNLQEDTKLQPVFDADTSDHDGMMNAMTRLPDMSTALKQSANQDEEDRSISSHMPTTDSRDGMASESAGSSDTKFLHPGDLVELDYTSSERNSVLAVFIQRVPGNIAQLFTMQGRWVFTREKNITWSLPGWASKPELTPLMKHLPKPMDHTEMEELLDRAHVHDLSVPRSVSGPIVTRLVKFWTETQEIYRKHASVLDNAHNLLAHETDLRYGSLVSASSTLLQIPARELPVTALYAVRSALGRAPLAFSIDPRSHRITGYLQIRSKEQVRMIQYVRDWLRDWQDDIAAKTQTGHGDRKRKYGTSRGAQYIYSFLDKARRIVLKSRENRDILPQPTGNIGISKKRFPITEDSSAVRITQNTQFTEQDIEIVRFIEAWCASGTLRTVNAYMALPPMILQATGLYEQFEQLHPGVGFTFLQELGVLLPYENRIRFDPHLLLPSSQHSKPLQNLMDNLIKMQYKHQFQDSMQELRKDWGSLPVFCVDDAGAQEIDDGVSIESVEGSEEEYWLHAHVANPTAFFGRDHSLAKMARHMGESIYMPERAYMMLPRWATSRHFSLAKGRPCITFSTRVDSEANILERKVIPGLVQNVVNLTPSEVTGLLGEKDPSKEKIVLTVGGDPPPHEEKQSMINSVTEEMKQSLRTMKSLSEKLSAKRLGRGGIFFDNLENDVSVWQNNKGQGLAWDHPWRRGSRTVEGDPVIQLKTPGLVNWFAPKISAGGSLIREMMLLAGETAATWCSDRGIPTIFRGTVHRPDNPDADGFYHEVVAPAVEEYGEIPMYVGVRYFAMQGATSLRTTAFPHKVAGLDQYAKTTSPLRRYGDMIVHWQIEAALREEARRGRSLTAQDIQQDASFLPFSNTVLQTIMLGLAPREHLISRAKAYAREFWMMMLIFRALHFDECDLPFAPTLAQSIATGKPLLQVFLHAVPTGNNLMTGTATMLNMAVQISDPAKAGLGESRRGDVWEVEVQYVDVYKRVLTASPLRLVERPIDERLERWKAVAP